MREEPGPDNATERRRHSRKNIFETQLLTVDLLLDPAGQEPRQRSGIVLDLSMDGMGLQPFLSLRPGSLCQLHLELPATASPFESRGLVSWVGGGGRAGIRFIDVAVGVRKQLAEWLAARGLQLASEVDQLPLEQTAGYSNTVAEAEPGTFQAWVRLVTNRARIMTGASGAAVALGDRNGAIKCYASVGNVPDVEKSMQRDAGLSGYCMSSGEIVHCVDTQSDPRVDAELARQLGPGSIAIVPVFACGKLAGLLEVFSPRAHAFNEGHLSDLKRYADFLCATIEAQRIEDHLRRSSRF